MAESGKYIQITSGCRRFVSFQNRDGKRWLVPLRHMKTGLELYEPSSVQGKMLKKLLWMVSAAGLGTRLGLTGFCDVELTGGLKDLLDSMYQGYEVSIFGGTPSADQKTTIQIFRGTEILGYCKLGTSSRVRGLFSHEMKILKLLEHCRVDHVPRCRGVFGLDPVTSALIQTTEKRTGARTEHRFGPRQKVFLDALFEKTKRDVAFEETDYHRSLLCLEENIGFLKAEHRDRVAQAVEKVLARYRGKRVLWGVCHRGFTPWNTCVADGRLFAFDFEYALRYAPPEMDRWHFFVQTLRYEKKRSGEEIAAAFCREFPGREDSFRQYLLDNISLYLLRGSREDRETADRQAHLLACVDAGC